MKKLGIFLLLAASVVANAAEDFATRIANRGTITVATEGTYPPFTFHDEQGNLTGYDVEVVRALAKQLGVTLELKEVPWAGLLAGLNDGRFDAVANEVSLTEERKAKYVSTTPYSYSGSALVVRADRDDIHHLDDIKGKKAGVPFSSSFSDLLRKKGAEIEPVEGGLGQEVLLVAQGRTDFTLNDRLAVRYFSQKIKNGSVKVIDLPEEGQISAGLFLRKADANALPALDAALEALRKDGTLAKISKQFFGEDVSVQ